MPYAVIEKSGCGIHKNRATLRIDMFMEPTDPYYDKNYLYVIDKTSPEWLVGYQGLLDKYGYPVDLVGYKLWKDSLPHIWQNTPFHSHFIYPDKVASDADIKAEIDRCLIYFYQFHNACWNAGKEFIEEWKKVPSRAGDIRCSLSKGDSKDLEAYQIKVQAIIGKIDEFQVGRKIKGDFTLPTKEGTIDVGPDGTLNRTDNSTRLYTQFNLDNPANADGTIDTIQYYAESSMSGGCKAALFFLISGTTYESRSSQATGALASGSHQVTGLSLAVVTGDFIGHYETDFAGISKSLTGYGGMYSISGNYTNPTTQGSYTLLAGDASSFYGTGTEAGGWTNIAKVNGVTAASMKTVVAGITVATVAKLSGVAV